MSTDTLSNLLSVEAIACLPAGGPWAVRVLAGMLAFELEGELTAPFPDAADDVRALAQACALRKANERGTFVHYQQQEAAFALGPDSPFPQLDGRNAFVLLYSEYQLGFACLWEGLEEPAVFWFDEEDGSHRSIGRLEKWCRGVLQGWALQLEVDDAELELVLVEPEAFGRYLRALTDARERAAAEALKESARLEREVMALEASGQLSEAAFQAWSDAEERAAALQGRPWPRP